MPGSANKSLSRKIQITIPLTVMGFPQLIGASLSELLMQSVVVVVATRFESVCDHTIF